MFINFADAGRIGFRSVVPSTVGKSMEGPMPALYAGFGRAFEAGKSMERGHGFMSYAVIIVTKKQIREFQSEEVYLKDIACLFEKIFEARQNEFAYLLENMRSCNAVYYPKKKKGTIKEKEYARHCKNKELFTETLKKINGDFLLAGCLFVDLGEKRTLQTEKTGMNDFLRAFDDDRLHENIYYRIIHEYKEYCQ